MENNESLPPPPPPGQPLNPPAPPGPPPGPPAYHPPPSYSPPTPFPPTTQIPVTQQFPPTQGFPGGPPAGFPPSGMTGFGQPAEPPKKKTWLIISGAVVAVAAVVAGVLIATGGDDKTVAPATTAITTIVETIPEVTTPPEDTLVITLPVITEPEVTQPAITDPAITEPAVTDPVSVTTIMSGGEIIDDLGAYSIVLPYGLAVDTTPITTKDDIVLPSIAGAVDLQGFYSDDVTPGMYSVLAREDANSSPDEVLAYLEPADGLCTGREQTDDYATALGTATLLKLDGCAGTASKVILVIAIEGSGSIFALYVQGAGASADLLSQAQTVFESVRLL